MPRSTAPNYTLEDKEAFRRKDLTSLYQTVLNSVASFEQTKINARSQMGVYDPDQHGKTYEDVLTIANASFKAIQTFITEQVKAERPAPKPWNSPTPPFEGTTRPKS